MEKVWFTHKELLNGATLELEMGPYSNKQWCVNEEAAPPSKIGKD